MTTRGTVLRFLTKIELIEPQRRIHGSSLKKDERRVAVIRMHNSSLLAQVYVLFGLREVHESLPIRSGNPPTTATGQAYILWLNQAPLTMSYPAEKPARDAFSNRPGHWSAISIISAAPFGPPHLVVELVSKVLLVFNLSLLP